MRVVALDAKQPGAEAAAGLPETVLTTMHTGRPVPINDPVALGAKLHDVPGRNLRPVVIDKGVAVDGMMAVEAKAIVPVLKLDISVLVENGQGFSSD